MDSTTNIYSQTEPRSAAFRRVPRWTSPLLGHVGRSVSGMSTGFGRHALRLHMGHALGSPELFLREGFLFLMVFGCFWTFSFLGSGVTRDFWRWVHTCSARLFFTWFWVRHSSNMKQPRNWEEFLFTSHWACLSNFLRCWATSLSGASCLLARLRPRPERPPGAPSAL